VKMLCGVVLLCLSALWAFLWCAQLSDPMLDAGYQVLFVLVASLALIPVFWATWLIDSAWRAPLTSTTAPIALQVRRRDIEAKTESDDKPFGVTPAAETKPPTPAAA
jgi:hypothetical protein